MFFLLAPLQHEIFYVNPKIHIEMNRLKTIATWIPLIPQIKKLHNSHVIIQALNITFLYQHYKDINHDHNLQISHILYLIETRNTPYIKKCGQISKFIKIYIYFNP
jgi:hypothetical protein